ncbi:hypothetical protein LCGC14_0466480 [marine sediment metagenome]|uniref:Uncharacterized protein n=1 Tax=marine sediment metagenome TaxID=412755 RepID=A0A0F9VMF8_9ZZZZ
MTAPILSAMLGVLLSLCTSYIPGFNTWFKTLGQKPDGSNDGNLKRLVMLGSVTVIGFISLGLSCSSFGVQLLNSISITLVCSEAGLVEVVLAIGGAWIGNQEMYKLSPRIARPKPPKRAMGDTG